MDLLTVQSILDGTFKVAMKNEGGIEIPPLTLSAENQELANSLSTMCAKPVSSAVFIKPHFSQLPPMF